jgi:hypothetical protein
MQIYELTIVFYAKKKIRILTCLVSHLTEINQVTMRNVIKGKRKKERA